MNTRQWGLLAKIVTNVVFLFPCVVSFRHHLGARLSLWLMVTALSVSYHLCEWDRCGWRSQETGDVFAYMDRVFAIWAGFSTFLCFAPSPSWRSRAHRWETLAHGLAGLSAFYLHTYYHKDPAGLVLAAWLFFWLGVAGLFYFYHLLPQRDPFWFGFLCCYWFAASAVMLSCLMVYDEDWNSRTLGVLISGGVLWVGGSLFYVVVLFRRSGTQRTAFHQLHHRYYLVLGTFFTLLGGALFQFGGEANEETERFLHSLWHVTIALGSGFLLLSALSVRDYQERCPRSEKHLPYEWRDDFEEAPLVSRTPSSTYENFAVHPTVEL